MRTASDTSAMEEGQDGRSDGAPSGREKDGRPSGGGPLGLRHSVDRIGKRKMRIAARRTGDTKGLLTRAFGRGSSLPGGIIIKEESEDSAIEEVTIVSSPDSGVSGELSTPTTTTMATTTERVDRLLAGASLLFSNRAKSKFAQRALSESLELQVEEGQTTGEGVASTSPAPPPSSDERPKSPSPSIASASISHSEGISCGSSAMSVCSEDETVQESAIILHNDEPTNNADQQEASPSSPRRQSPTPEAEDMDLEPDMIGFKFDGVKYDVGSSEHFPEHYRGEVLDAAAKMVTAIEKQQQLQQQLIKVEGNEEELPIEEEIPIEFLGYNADNYQGARDPRIGGLADEERQPWDSGDSLATNYWDHMMNSLTDNPPLVRKIFIGGLAFSTTETDLANYFSKYGVVESVDLKFDPITNISRGYGFITFTEDKAVQEVLKNPMHILFGRWVEARRAKARPINKKVFVTGIDATLSKNDIIQYFSRYGKVRLVDIPWDRTREPAVRRHFGFVYFFTEEAVDVAAILPRQLIRDRLVTVRKMIPNLELQAALKQKRLAHVAEMTREAKYNFNKLRQTPRVPQAQTHPKTTPAPAPAPAHASPMRSCAHSHGPPGPPPGTFPQMSHTPNGALTPYAEHIPPGAVYPLAPGNQCCCQHAAAAAAGYPPMPPANYLAYMPAYPAMYPPMMPQAYLPMPPYGPVPGQAHLPGPDPHWAYGQGFPPSNNGTVSLDYSSYYAATYAPPPPPPPPPETTSQARTHTLAITSSTSTMTGTISGSLAGTSLVPKSAESATAAAATNSTTISASACHYTSMTS